VSWSVVARKDFQDAIRSRGLIAMTILFTLLYAGAAYVYTFIGSSSPQAASVLSLISFLLLPATILVPIVGVFAGYRAIAGERETGSIKLLLGLPHTRQDVVIGKIVGRSSVVTVSTFVGFLVAAVVAAVLYSSFPAVDFVAFGALTVLFALAFVGIGVGISAATGSTTKAIAGGFGVFLLFQFLWGEIPKLINYIANGSYGFSGRQPNWSYLFEQLDPQNAYQLAVNEWVVQSPLREALYQQVFGGNPPLFFSPWFALAVLLAWVLVPAGLGYLAFKRADL
jgi:ABC-2 type transport system permease protein